MTMVYVAWHGDDSTDHAELSLEKREETDRETERERKKVHSHLMPDLSQQPLHYTVCLEHDAAAAAAAVAAAAAIMAIGMACCCCCWVVVA